MPTTSTAALGAVAPADVGKASGANSTLQRFGGVFGIAIATAVFIAHGHLGTPVSFEAGCRPALAVAAGLSLLGATTTLLVAGRRRTAAIGRRRPRSAAERAPSSPLRMLFGDTVRS